MDWAHRAGAIHRQADIFGDINRQRQRPAYIRIIIRRSGGIIGDTGDGRVVVDHPGEGGLVSARGFCLRQYSLQPIG